MNEEEFDFSKGKRGAVVVPKCYFCDVLLQDNSIIKLEIENNSGKHILKICQSEKCKNKILQAIKEILF